MKCPFCSCSETRVIDSRPAEENRIIKRRRLCDDCGKRFTTYEKVESLPLMVIKKDKGRQIYRREKLEQGILRACYKRPVNNEAIEKAVDDIEKQIYSIDAKEISSNEIGRLVMDRIKSLDGVAYVRFASVYREFKDVNTFMEELRKTLGDIER